ncbi:MAG: 50S ribosomal protein L4 [Actinobacteria bacterium]|nr:50S ribosomal protein L4 [Actinomycetota bacterium]
MSEAKTVKVLGSKAATAELPAELFDVQTNVPLIHQVVVAQQAATLEALAPGRAFLGVGSSEAMNEVPAGMAWPEALAPGFVWGARQGSRRAPQWTGGGVVHGPQPRDYSQRTPKKMIAAALRGALSDRARDGRVHVVESIVTGETPSTKAALKALAEVGSTKLLVVLDREEDVAWLSLRNVPTVHALAVDQLNAYDVLVSDDVVFTTAALATFVAGPVKGAVTVVATETEEAAK